MTKYIDIDLVKREMRNKVDSYKGSGIISISVVKQHCEDFLSFLGTISEEPTHTEYNDARVDLSKFDDDIRDFGEGFCEDKPKPYWDGVYEALEVMRSWGKLVKNIYEEPDKSLEEAAGEQAKSFGYMSQDVEFKENVESFIAGTEWQKSQMLKDAFMDNDVVHDGRIELEGDPLPSLDPILILPYPQFEPGDKVKVIVLKDNEDESK